MQRTLRRGPLRADETLLGGGELQIGELLAIAPQGNASPPWHSAQMEAGCLQVDLQNQSFMSLRFVLV